jgi:hypothetical protein
MTTSGVTTYQDTRNQLIQSALRKLGVLATGQTPTSEDYSNGADALNMLVAEYRTLGMPLWKRNTYSFNPTVNVSSYNIGSGYTLNTSYPLKLLQAWRLDTSTSSRTPMDIIADSNFNLLPSNSTGTPIQITYQPKVNYGVIKLWPTPDSATPTIYIVYQNPTEYFNASTDTMDYPEEWYHAIVYGLAVRLAPEYGIPLPDRQLLMKEADLYLARALSFGDEDGSIFFQPNRNRW